jgi:hypothetical protein
VGAASRTGLTGATGLTQVAGGLYPSAWSMKGALLRHHWGEPQDYL